MAEVYPDSNSDKAEPKKADPKAEFSAWFKELNAAEDAKGRLHMDLIGFLDDLHNRKNGLAEALLALRFEEQGSDLQLDHMADVDEQCEKIPATISDSLMHYFALEPDNTSRFAFAYELLQTIDIGKIDRTGTVVQRADPLHTSRAFRELFIEETPESAIPATIQDMVEDHLYDFANDVATHYGMEDDDAPEYDDRV